MKETFAMDSGGSGGGSFGSGEAKTVMGDMGQPRSVPTQPDLSSPWAPPSMPPAPPPPPPAFPSTPPRSAPQPTPPGAPANVAAASSLSHTVLMSAPAPKIKL